MYGAYLPTTLSVCVLDTTASHTGRRQGSATRFEQKLGKGIIFLACRYHIGELHIEHADVEARGAWTGTGTSFGATEDYLSSF